MYCTEEQGGMIIRIKKSDYQTSFIEQCDSFMPDYLSKEENLNWVNERLLDAMVEALFKQKMLTESQRRDIRTELKIDILTFSSHLQ